MQTSYLSRLMAVSSEWPRYRSLLVSNFENIQPMESLQLAPRLLSRAERVGVAPCFTFIHVSQPRYEFIGTWSEFLT